MEKFITVTQPHMPAIEDFMPYLQNIWESRWLTNAGRYHQELEIALAEYLGVPYVSLFCNGTIALITALKALDVVGEVITTPYSFVATSHSLLWNNIKPVFVDIDLQDFNLDPKKIAEKITSETTAILPVHCYGTPCKTDQISEIAKSHDLKVIYDAAHAFGVRKNNQSILNFGDLSVLSFHATKVFNTFEGGAIVSHDLKSKLYIDQLKNFGISDEVTVSDIGINGKMNEIQAAFGLLQLRGLELAIENRKRIDDLYRNAISSIPGLQIPPLGLGVKSNYSYFPVLVHDSYPLTRDELYELFKLHGFLTRRYFYPLISDMPMYRSLPSANPINLPNSKYVADRILCIPIYPDLASEKQSRIINILQESK
jgi:dTDP-4-amino-4,6-dideoxy-D-glucose transaminase